jgi:hypothetical protein
MTFHYRCGDRQIGPVSWEELVALARGGGLRPFDMVWGEGWPAWQAAQTVPGLLSATPPPFPIQAPPPRPLGDDAAMRFLLPVGRSGWAIAAGYLGLFGVLVFPAPFALIAGILAIRDIKAHPEKHGMGRAIFGLVIGILGTGILALLLIRAIL